MQLAQLCLGITGHIAVALSDVRLQAAFVNSAFS